MNPRTHLRLRDAEKRLGHSRRWLLLRIKRGQFEAFRHSPTDLTISLESIVAYEDRVRVNRTHKEKFKPLPLAG